jgi:hypothetical protein
VTVEVDPRAVRRELESALAGRDISVDSDAATIKLVARLGAVTAEIGNRHQARGHFRRVAECGPAVLGDDHPAVRQARAYLSGAPLQLVTPPATPAPSATADVTERSGTRTRKRWIVAGGLVAAVIVATTVAIAARSGADRHRPPRLPSAPAQVAVAIGAGTARVTWSDPADGRVPFLIVGGAKGSSPTVRQEVPPGRTSVSISGLAGGSEYCFTVAAVYASDLVATSAAACATTS